MQDNRPRVRPREPRVFSGSADVTISQFLQSALEYLELSNAPEEHWVRLAASYFDGDAATWWSAESARLDWTRLSWANFREHCYARWSPVVPSSVAYSQLHSMRMGDLTPSTVDTYTREFNRLLTYVNYDIISEPARIIQYRNGLTQAIRVATPQVPASLHDAQSHAALAEATIHPNVARRLIASQSSTAPASSSQRAQQSEHGAPQRGNGRRGRGAFRGRGRGAPSNRGGTSTAHSAQVNHAQITDGSRTPTEQTVELDTAGEDVEFFAAALKGAQRNRDAWAEWSAKRSPEEMRQLKAEGRCFKCTQPGHQTPDCKNKAHFQ